MLPFEAKLQKVKGMLEILHALGEGNVFCDLGEASSDVRISYFPPEKAKLGAFYYAREHFGRLDKGPQGTMCGSRDGVTLTLFGILTCRVKEYETVVVPAVEEHTIQKPVYECLSPLAAAAAATAEEPAEEVPF